MAELSTQYKEKANKLIGELNGLEKIFPNQFENIVAETERYKEFLQNKALQVAVVGTVKAGKSTLMNAILGVDLTSTDVTPETASLAIIKRADKNQVKVSFYNKDEWKALQNDPAMKGDNVFAKKFDELGAASHESEYIGKKDVVEYPDTIEKLRDVVKDYTSSKKPLHFFVKQIEIGLENVPLKGPIAFVDTPGLNDPLKYRSDITKRYIDDANAVIVCVTAKALENTAVSTLTKVFERIGSEKAKVIVCGTQTDTLNHPKEEWEKQKKNWFESLENLFKDSGLMDKNTIGLSSYMYALVNNVINGKEVEKRNALDICSFADSFGIDVEPKSLAEDKSKLDKIKEATNVDHFIQVLKNGPLGEPEKMLNEEMKEKYDRIVGDAKGVAKKRKEDIEKNLQLLNEDIKDRKEAKEKKERELAEIEKKEQDIKNRLNQISEDANAALKELKNELMGQLKSNFGGR